MHEINIVKVTRKFGRRVPSDSPDMTPDKYFRKVGVVTVTWPRNFGAYIHTHTAVHRWRPGLSCCCCSYLELTVCPNTSRPHLLVLRLFFSESSEGFSLQAFIPNFHDIYCNFGSACLRSALSFADTLIVLFTYLLYLHRVDCQTLYRFRNKLGNKKPIQLLLREPIVLRTRN